MQRLKEMGIGASRLARVGVVLATLLLGSGATWAQAEGSTALLGPQAFRIGSSIMFTVHQRVAGNDSEGLVSTFIASCNGKLVSNPFAFEVTAENVTTLRAQQALMLASLQSPINTSIALGTWEDSDVGYLGPLRTSALRMCNGAQAMPGNVLIPVDASKEVVLSAVGARGSRKGSIVELWTEGASFREEPRMYDGKPIVVDGVEVKKSIFTGAKTLRRETYNCTDRTMGMSAAIKYLEGGKVGDSFDIGSSKPDFSAVVPNSIGESMLDFVCKVY